MPLFDMKKIGVRLKNARKKANFSQELLADFLEIDQSLIARYENGERPITMDSLDKLANLYRCSFDYFISEEETDIPLKGVALRGSGVSGEDLKVIARMNVIISNIHEMELLMEE